MTSFLQCMALICARDPRRLIERVCGAECAYPELAIASVAQSLADHEQEERNGRGEHARG